MLCSAVVLLGLVSGGGCEKESTRADSGDLTATADLKATVGLLAEVARPQPIAVEGYGLVGGLAGTGSPYCPPAILDYLRRYILAQMTNGQQVNLDELLSSKNVAVVLLEAEIPATASKDDHFDVRVSLMPGSAATSVQGGWLYRAELMPKGTLGVDARTQATVEGAVFVNTIETVQPDLKSGYILGGGRVLYDYAVTLRMRQPGYRTTSLVRNRLSERYGPSLVRALSPSEIEVRIPPEYRYRKERFVAMIPATFLEATNELTEARVSALVQRLAVSGDGDRDNSEIALEAIGRDSLAQLSTLLNAADAGVRLGAARCMLGLGDDRALGALRDLAQDPQSSYRLEALEAVAVAGRRNDASALARRLLRDDDATVVLAACAHLRRMEDPAVTREVVGRSFLLERVVQTDRKAVFVSRSGDPHIVLFGSPLACRDNVFVESPDRTIVVDAKVGQDYVSVFRSRPSQPGVIGPVRTGRGLPDLIRALGEEPALTPQGQLAGLGLPYSSVIALLEQLTVKDAVPAQFWAGPLPKIGLAVKKQEASGR
jgi:hypothetical protein